MVPFMNSQTRKSPQDEETIKLVRRRAENLFKNHRPCCSESLLLVLNHGFKWGLSSGQSKQLGDGFCSGTGEAGCTCGALSCAVMGLGLPLGPHVRGLLNKKNFSNGTCTTCIWTDKQQFTHA